jgi:hypothetical protein
MSKNESHKEPETFDDVNRRIELAKAEGDIELLKKLYIEKMEIAASLIQHRELRNILLGDILKLTAKKN